jgi:hypothetical protein
MKDSNMGIGGDLGIRPLKNPRPATAKSLRIPLLNKRIILTSDPGSGSIMSSDYMQSNLWAIHRDGDQKVKDAYNLGSGNVQQNMVVALMQDIVGTASNLAAPILTKLKYMYSGTGATANTYDYALLTAINTASGSITPTLGYSSDNTTIQWVGTIAYTGTAAVTEWGLYVQANGGGAPGVVSVSQSSTNTWNSQGQASATWGTSLGASPNALAGYVTVIGASSATPNAASQVGLYVISNGSGTSGTVVGAVSPTTAFYNLTAGGGSATTPSSNTVSNIWPLMADHKTFAAINVVNGDSIQFTYTLTLTSGG